MLDPAACGPGGPPLPIAAAPKPKAPLRAPLIKLGAKKAANKLPYVINCSLLKLSPNPDIKFSFNYNN